MSEKMRNTASKNMALASICASMSTMLLCVGFYLGIGDFIWYFFASFAFIPLLCKGLLRESVVAFFATTTLSLALCGFNYVFVLPFATLFGFYPMMYYYLALKVKKNAARKTIKLLVFEFGMFMMWRFTYLFVGETEFLEKYMLPILLFFGIVLFFMYDYIIMRLIFICNYYMRKLEKKK